MLELLSASPEFTLTRADAPIRVKKKTRTKQKEKRAVATFRKEQADYHLSYEIGEFISKYTMNFDYDEIRFFNTRSSDKVILNTPSKTRAIVNLERINNYRKINRFFEDVNCLLQNNDLFISSVETHTVRKNRILKKVPSLLRGAYYTLDFVCHRICPKLNHVKKLYFKLTRGYNRVLTKAEAFGRLYACGFEMVDDMVIDGRLFFVARKRAAPSYDSKPTYGPLISLKRVGKNGKIINVFKVRTMHPYAEYLQQYLYNRNSLKTGGKIKSDFRISRFGRLFRKYWIDELPMLINFIKGEMKFIGVRPLSEHYFSLYPKELQQKRTQVKPGLFPPFYVDMPETLDEIIKSEEKYLDLYMKNPIMTDMVYFFKIIVNIVFKGNRSA